MFGSNGLQTADYSRGVLERFTRRATNEINSSTFVKMILNPRTVNFFDSPHFAMKFEGIATIDERGEHRTQQWTISPPLNDKIVINHYHCKSWEEYSQRVHRGDVVKIESDKYNRELFDKRDRNDEFDDGILKYRDERLKIYQPPDKSHADERLINALTENLSPTLIQSTPPEFFAGKMETFLTCRAVADYLKLRLPDNTLAKFFEETALKATLKSTIGMSFADARLLIRELPNLLKLPYPVVKDLRGAMLQIIPQMMNIMHLNNIWRDYAELDYINELLKE